MTITARAEIMLPKLSLTEGKSATKAPPNLENLVQENLGWLRGWVGARLHGYKRQDSDDICQEILLRVIRGQGSLRNPDSFAPWLYRIANNVLRDHFRRQVTRRVETIGIEEDPVDLTNTDEKLERDEELHGTIKALLALPRRYRDPMLLRHVDDLSYAEIGKILRISENAVQVRIFRARKMLRNALSGHVDKTRK